MNLDKKQALVTGGAVRIGRAITEALQSAGAEVIVHYLRSKKEAEHLSSKTVHADLSDPAQCESLLDDVASTFGPVDLLVNNAAVFYQTRLPDASTSETMKELQPNFLAPLALIRGFARQTRTGRIVNLLDRRISGHDTSCVPYQLSKKALEELTRLAALELAPGITVNAVAPGAILPPPQEVDNPSWEPAGTIPLNRRPPPDAVAGAVLYLLQNDYISGQTLFIDSGQHLLHEGKV